MKHVHLDFETYSECPIKLGAAKYARHPSTEVLCMAYAVDDEPPVLWTRDKVVPGFMIYPDGFHFHAWNANFEREIWKNIFWFDLPPIQQWTDTAATAAMLALPRSLGACGAALGMPEDEAKDKRGKYLIQQLCKPVRGKRRVDPELKEELYSYCIQDVIAERAIARKFGPLKLNAIERRVWEIDQAINERGIYVDVEAVKAAQDIHAQITENMMDELRGITGLANPNSRNQFLGWLNEQGVDVDNTQKTTLSVLMESL